MRRQQLVVYNGGPVSRGAHPRSTLASDWPFETAYDRMDIDRSSLLALKQGKKLLYRADTVNAPQPLIHQMALGNCGGRNVGYGGLQLLV